MTKWPTFSRKCWPTKVPCVDLPMIGSAMIRLPQSSTAVSYVVPLLPSKQDSQYEAVFKLAIATIGQFVLSQLLIAHLVPYWLVHWWRKARGSIELLLSMVPTLIWPAVLGHWTPGPSNPHDMVDYVVFDSRTKDGEFFFNGTAGWSYPIHVSHSNSKVMSLAYDVFEEGRGYRKFMSFVWQYSQATGHAGFVQCQRRNARLCCRVTFVARILSAKL